MSVTQPTCVGLLLLLLKLPDRRWLQLAWPSPVPPSLDPLPILKPLIWICRKFAATYFNQFRKAPRGLGMMRQDPQDAGKELDR